MSESNQRTSATMPGLDASVPEAAAPQPGAAGTVGIVLVERPKRPLSAYNLFFQDERQRLLATRSVRPQGAPRRSHGKLGFSEMAKLIASKWRTIDPESKSKFDALAKEEKAEYRKKLGEWKQLNKKHTKKPKRAPQTAVRVPRSGAAVTPDCKPAFRLPTAGEAKPDQPKDEGKAMAPTEVSPPLAPMREEGEQVFLSSARQHELLNAGIERLAEKLQTESVDFFIDLFRAPSMH